MKGHFTKHTEETKQKIRLKQLGVKESLETRAKISKALLGNQYAKGKNWSFETRQKQIIARVGVNTWTKGTKHTLEQRQKRSERMKKMWQDGVRNIPVGRTGKDSTNWKGGITVITRGIRRSNEYVIWRKAVMERDNKTCIWCGVTENLHVDHIKRFIDYPELRFAIDNGRVLCFDCHKTTDTYGKKKQ